MATHAGTVAVVDLITAGHDSGILCDTCSDPIVRGELIAILSNGAWVHEDGCGPGPEAEHVPDIDESRGNRL